jgi:redox-sensitive bicupin YhaK (pirin superfamily)
MSYHAASEPECKKTEGTIELIVEPRVTDLGEFEVRRVLPSRDRRMVGPFVFFDHLGPAEFPPGKGISVRPHPHIGLATVTYLFEGEILHRDSLGFTQPIRPGAVNLMTAGRGIVHSERAGADLDELSRLHGIQSWMALPEDMQEIEPAFVHYPAAELPELNRDNVKVRLIIGKAFGVQSPVAVHSSMLYLECRMPAGSSLLLPDGYDESAVYVVEGELQVDDKSIRSGLMAVACPGKIMRLDARVDSRIMVIGGANLGPRRMWWNFVSTSKERIEQAKEDWRAGRFGRVPGDEDEFIPLPD